MADNAPASVARPQLAELPTSLRLKDGTAVTIRLIVREDEGRMVKFHVPLSDRTVWMRYFSSMSFSRRTAHERLAHICASDGEQETVLVAVCADSSEEHPIIGVGRLNRLQSPKDAELALLISDEYQHKGLGTELLRRLIEAARIQKIDRIVAEVLRDNLAMQVILKRSGFYFGPVDFSESIRAIFRF